MQDWKMSDEDAGLEFDRTAMRVRIQKTVKWVTGLFVFRTIRTIDYSYHSHNGLFVPFIFITSGFTSKSKHLSRETQW